MPNEVLPGCELFLTLFGLLSLGLTPIILGIEPPALLGFGGIKKLILSSEVANELLSKCL
jgi:hypothetical protein